MYYLRTCKYIHSTRLVILLARLPHSLPLSQGTHSLGYDCCLAAMLERDEVLCEKKKGSKRFWIRRPAKSFTRSQNWSHKIWSRLEKTHTNLVQTVSKCRRFCIRDVTSKIFCISRYRVQNLLHSSANDPNLLHFDPKSLAFDGPRYKIPRMSLAAAALGPASPPPFVL